MRWTPGLIKLKPEVLQKQVGKLTEEYGALFVEGTLRDGFIVPQVLYFFVKRAKIIQKHLDRYRKNKVRVFRLIFVDDRIHRFEWYYRCVKFLTASWKYIFCYGFGWYLWPILKTMRSKRFCAEDRTFLSEGGRGEFPFGNPFSVASDPFKDTEVFHVRILYIDLPRRFRTFPFGNIGQFAFVNPFRRNESTFSAMPGRSCA